MKDHHCGGGNKSVQKMETKGIGIQFKKKSKSRSEKSEHPDHSPHIKKLNRIVGQLQGVQRMIAARRYCPDILIQTRAACSAIKAIELSILQTHLEHCVTETMASANAHDSEQKVQELLDIVKRF
mgnify:CR=1 FL=1